jgi:hypothetical protein
MLWDLDRHNAEYNVLAYSEPYEDVERFSQARAERDRHHLQGYLCNMKDTVLSFDVHDCGRSAMTYRTTMPVSSPLVCLYQSSLT